VHHDACAGAGAYADADADLHVVHVHAAGLALRDFFLLEEDQGEGESESELGQRKGAAGPGRVGIVPGPDKVAMCRLRSCSALTVQWI
jgi:hypothetical protein